jgi:hypothetical protein
MSASMPMDMSRMTRVVATLNYSSSPSVSGGNKTGCAPLPAIEKAGSFACCMFNS